MSPAENADESDDRDSMWSGAPSRAGLELITALALAVALVAVPAMVVGGLAFAVIPVLPWWLGVLLGLLVAMAVVWLRVGRADATVLAPLGPRLAEAHLPVRLVNMVEGLTLAGGVVPPAIVVLDDPARNAMAVRCRGRNHLVFTRGLVESLQVVELEGAVAELLSRLRNGDAEAATLGAALFGRPLVDGPLKAVLAPVATIALGRLLPADRDLEADRQAVSLTRYPPGLLRALRSMSGADLRPAAVTDGTAHLWLADPNDGRAPAGHEHRAPMSLRIDVLAEL
jgi:heat shock protein HtpX